MEVIEERRQLIPRWHTSKMMANLHLNHGELNLKGLIAKDKNLEGFRLNEALEAWKLEKNKATAIELYIKSIVTGVESSDTLQAKKYLNNLGALSDPIKKLLNEATVNSTLFYPTSEDEIFKKIQSLKKKSIEYPNDAMVWNDLAFYYAALGNNLKSKRSMQVAFKVSNLNAIIARSFSRLLVHQGDPEEAIHTLKKTGLNNNSPIVLSADISIKTVFNIGHPDIKRGLNLIERYKDNPRLISELSACIGTLELEIGATKTGKALLKNALVKPTENVISQIHWLIHKKHLNFDKSTISSLEGSVISHYENENYEQCKNALLDLHNFQPFSESPIVDAGYMSLVALDQPNEAIRIYNAYEHISKNSFMATNNYSVAQLENGNIDQATLSIERMSKMTRSEDDEAVFNATKAMYFYKKGEPHLGKPLYESSLNFFSKKNDQMHLGRLLLYFGKEEIKYNLEQGRLLLERSKKIIEKSKSNRELLKLYIKANKDFTNKSDTKE